MPRVLSSQEAVAHVRPRDRIYVHGAAATPHVLLDALVARAGDLHDVELVHLHTEGPAPYTDPGMAQHFRHNALFIGANVRPAVQRGDADYTPIFLAEIPALFRPGGTLPIDVAFVHVTPPDDRGRCSLGVSVDCTLAAIANASLVIAQVNPRMPRTGGHQVSVEDLDILVHVDEPLPVFGHAKPSPVTDAIGRHVAALIDDGSTLQMGIGAVPDAVLAALTGHKDLGVHTEMFTDGLIPLIESGVVNGAEKNYHRRIVVSAFAAGSQDLYRFIDNNPTIQLHPVDYTNNVDVIAAHHRMVAINSALSVDLTGQVAADSIGTAFYSGIGGQVDFIRGAARSEGGVPIIALPSTAKGGSISRIATRLLPGAGVVTTRGDVHWVVTEFGARNLHGHTIRDRARMLIEIAHPAHRQRLEDEAAAIGYLGRR